MNSICRTLLVPIIIIMIITIIIISPFSCASSFILFFFLNNHEGFKGSPNLFQGIQLLGVVLRVLSRPYPMILPRRMIADNQTMCLKQFQDQRVPLCKCLANNLLRTKQAITVLIKIHNQ